MITKTTAQREEDTVEENLSGNERERERERDREFAGEGEIRN